jgi:hypothetical protein
VDDGEGGVRAVSEAGRLLGEPLPVAGELLSLQSAAGASAKQTIDSSEEGLARGAKDASWIAATHEGKVFGLSWAETALVKTWEKDLAERLLDVRLAASRIIVRTASGALLALDESREAAWKLPLAADDRFAVATESDRLVVAAPGELRVHDSRSGELRFHWSVTSPAVGVDVRGSSLLWVDRAGNAHEVDMATQVHETASLGLPLSAAVPTSGGFFITTAAGEVGFVEFKRGDVS